MALPYPTKVVLPFDIATAQDMNERHANDVALAAGTGLDDGAVPAAKLGVHSKIGTLNISTTGSKTISGLPFKPSWVEFKLFRSSSNTFYSHGWGCMSEDIQYAYGGQFRTSGSSLEGAFASSNAKCLYMVNQTNTVQLDATLTSMNSDGFTINLTAASAGWSPVVWVAHA